MFLNLSFIFLSVIAEHISLVVLVEHFRDSSALGSVANVGGFI